MRCRYGNLTLTVIAVLVFCLTLQSLLPNGREETKSSEKSGASRNVTSANTLQVIFLSEMLRENRNGGQRQPGGGIHATLYEQICTAE